MSFLSIRDVTFLSHAYHTLLITIRHHVRDHQLEEWPRLIRDGSRVAVPSDVLNNPVVVRVWFGRLWCQRFAVFSNLGCRLAPQGLATR